MSPAGVRFRHALFAEAAARLGEPHQLHARLAAAWQAVDGLDARASAAGHRLRAATTAAGIADAVETTCEVAAELVAAGQQARAAGLLARGPNRWPTRAWSRRSCERGSRSTWPTS